MGRTPSSKPSAATLRKRKQRQRDQAIAQGIDPDTIAKKQQPGIARTANPTAKQAAVHRCRDKKNEKSQDEQNTQAMSNMLGSFTGSGSDGTPSTQGTTQPSRDETLDKAYALLDRQLERDKRQQDLHKKRNRTQYSGSTKRRETRQ